MKPSVVRNVHYYPPERTAEHPVAAIVTSVNDDGTTVSLTALPPGFSPYPVRNVPFAETPQPGHWSWPPRVG